MELLLQRETRTDTSTIGRLSVDGVFECYILEDFDRGLNSSMSLYEIAAKKVFGQTAIPAGRYEVVITFSDRFQTYLPLLLDVPGYTAVRIHAGNAATDTEGCLLTGKEFDKDYVYNSRAALRPLLAKMKAAEKREKIFITIQ